MHLYIYIWLPSEQGMQIFISVRGKGINLDTMLRLCLRLHPHKARAYPILSFFPPRLKKYLRTHETMKLTQNDVVYMPNQYVAL